MTVGKQYSTLHASHAVLPYGLVPLSCVTVDNTMFDCEVTRSTIGLAVSVQTHSMVALKDHGTCQCPDH